jgi:GMP synthase (glutamine-hydrolysing)
MNAPRLLVIDGNTAQTRARHIASGGQATGEGYVRTLLSLDPTLQCDIVFPADGPLTSGLRLTDYAGATMTGSALNVYNGGPAVERQIDLVREMFAAGVPFFGSCWGLQIAVAAAGGVVSANPLGREFGFARRIELNDAGRQHPMFAGKPAVFEAPTIHRDYIERLPPGAIALAHNEMGLQAAEIPFGKGVCWGVQYHPEYTFGELAATARRYENTLLSEGLMASGEDVQRFIADLELLESGTGMQAVAWRYGLGQGILDPMHKLAELKNWLEHQVLSRR